MIGRMLEGHDGGAGQLDGFTTVVLAPNPSPLTLEGTNTYLLGEPRGNELVVVDPGPALPAHRRALDAVIAQRRARVRAVVLTHGHPDHAAAAGWAVEWDAPLFAFAADRHPRALPLRNGDGVGSQLRVWHTPGHTGDSICLQLLPTGAVFTGDHVLGRGSTVVAWPDGDVSDYLRSLDRLRSLSPSVLYPGHGPPLSDPAAAIDAQLRHRASRERQILDAVAAGDRSVAQILARVYTEVDSALQPAAALTVRAHLHKLRTEGKLPPGTSEGFTA